METEYTYFDSAEGEMISYQQCLTILWDHGNTDSDGEKFFSYFMDNAVPTPTTSKQGVEYVKRYIDAQLVLIWLGY